MEIVDSTDRILQLLQTKAHYPTKARSRKGKGRKGKARGKAAADDADDDDDADVMDDRREEDLCWADNLREGLPGIAATVRNELISKTVVPYFVEWCDEPKLPSEGLATDDACFRFVKSGPPYVEYVRKSSANNIYTYVPHLLRDTCGQAENGGISDASADERLRTFFAQTFWNNADAWRVQVAMCVLALSGRNIDRAWLSIGPGGGPESQLLLDIQPLRTHALLPRYEHLLLRR